MVPVAQAVTVVAAMLAILAGVTKLARPSVAVVAMRAVGLPSSPAVVRAGSVAECGIGVAALASTSWVPTALLAASYVALAAFVAVSLRTSPGVPCGCLGTPGAVSSGRHLALNAVCALGAATTAVSRGGTPIATEHATMPRVVVLVVGAASALLAAAYVARERVA